MLRVEGVSFAHGARPVLRAVSLHLPVGSFTTLLGPSGSGKTTLLQIIAGHVRPASGSVWLDGRDATGLLPEKRGLGLVHQHLALFPHLSVERNVSFGLEVRGVGRAQALRQAHGVLELVALEPELWRRLPAQLSGGQKQRVAIARALAFQPRVLLLDEPFTALDRSLRLQMRAELQRIQRTSGVTALLVTHDQEEAMALSDTVAVLREGRLLQSGTPVELYQRPRDGWLAGFLGEANLVTNGRFLGVPEGELLLVRPGELRYQIDPGPGDHALQGPVRAVSYQGGHSLVSFEVEGLVWKIFITGENTPRVGENIRAVLPARAGWNVTRGQRP